MTAPTHTPTAYHLDMIDMGYPFECTCGECHRSAKSALTCRKCRVYAADEARTATDLRTGKVSKL